TTVGRDALPPSDHSGGGLAPSRLCLNDFRDLARLEEAGAHAHAPGSPGDQRAHRDQVGQPAAPRQLVRVADRVADRRMLPADIAPLGHDHSSGAGFRTTGTNATYSTRERVRQTAAPPPGLPTPPAFLRGAWPRARAAP